MIGKSLALASVCALALISTTSATAAMRGIAQADSFRIGTDGVNCTAQNRSVDPQLKSMFDRAYAVVCQDAAAAIGKLYVVSGTPRILGAFSVDANCTAAEPVVLQQVPGAVRELCTVNESGLRYVRYNVTRDGRTYLAEGLAGYESAVRLGFQSIVSNQIVPGSVEVAVTEAGDPAAFARVQAGNLDPDQALAEGYARNNTGSFPEAAEFFDTLLDRALSGDTSFARKTEYAANRALQLSNMGRFAEAAPLFASAEQTVDPSDPVQLRLLRNFKMIHALNQGSSDQALSQLGAAMSRRSLQLPDADRLGEGFLDKPIVQRLNADDSRVKALGGTGGRLSASERSRLLDAQARHLQGVALRLRGQTEGAKAAQVDAIDRLNQVRGGRVVSADWLRAGILAEQAGLAEATGDIASARQQMEEAVALYQRRYPASPGLSGMRARLAVLLGRNGSVDEARALFRSAVETSMGNVNAASSMQNYLGAYFGILTNGDLAKDAGAVADLFDASQLLVRPGLAQTQAVFARELSGGTDEGARLFRYSLNLSRDIVRLDGDIGQLTARIAQDATVVTALEQAQRRRAQLGDEQTATLSKLAEYPQFRATSPGRIQLTELQKALRAGEGYYRMVIAGGRLFGIFATKDFAEAFPLAMTVDDLASRVTNIRDSIIVINEQGVTQTPPFDAAGARKLYVDLFGPVADRVSALDHLVFEPDGAMLQLPANLLITEQAGVDAYNKRQRARDADPYDMRGVKWLGRNTSVSVAVSTRGFVDIRNSPPSRAKRAYLGIGENAELTDAQRIKADNVSCGWPSQVWDRPISSDELKFAAQRFAGGNPDLILGTGFTDDALAARSDLNDYRILHFATHGLVSAPFPECPARPALVTSFGGEASDGLLTFKEVFDLRLDADLVLLSACDTAGAATVSATREAGLATGGNFALDGLVRAFVAAGARSIVASYWPVPDDYDATKTLINGLLSVDNGVPLGSALRRSQIGMMDNALTSHPFYWSAFAIVGDAQKQLSAK